MAQIKEFSSADLNTISRFGGVSNTLEKINGVAVTTPAAGFLLDTYTGAAAAYSVRSLSSSYTGPCMRVRRNLASAGTGHDDEADVAFDTNGEISLDSAVSNFNPSGSSATTLGQFLAASGYTDVDSLLPDTITATVSGWYDQSGNGNNATQSTSGSQPQIYNGTAVVTVGGKAAMQFDGTDDRFQLDVTATGLNLDVANTSSFHVAQYNNATNDRSFALSLGGVAARWYPGWMDNGLFKYGYNATTSVSTETANTDQNLFTMIAGSTLGQAEAWRNGVSKMTATLASSQIMGDVVGIGLFRTTFYLDGTVQEVIIYSSDQSSNRTGIEDNINAEFGIY